MNQAADSTVEATGPCGGPAAAPTIAFGAVPAISRRDAVCRRLDGIETVALEHAPTGRRRQIAIALPDGYAKKPRARFPLVLVLDPGDCFGSSVEMARLMEGTAETEGVVIAAMKVCPHDLRHPQTLAALIASDVLPACRERYRIADGRVALCDLATQGRFALQALWDGIAGITHFIIAAADADAVRAQLKRAPAKALQTGHRQQLVLASPADGTLPDIAADIARVFGAQLNIATREYPALTAQATAIPALTFGLCTLYATGRVYGQPVTPLRKAWLSRTLQFLAPLFGRLAKKPVRDTSSPYLVRSQIMGRDYEVFVALPDSWQAGSAQRYPLLLALDANIEFSIVAETAARLARDGETEEMIVVGLGTPRAEGPTEFAFRRFEELFPPHVDYTLDDDLGRIMRSLYATQGKDAQHALGHAPDLYRFITDELLPQLQRELPVARSDLGILGHSAAGAFVGYALYQPGTPFRRCVAVSPGIGISGSWLMREPATVAQGASLYVALGSEERRNLFNRIAGIQHSEAWATRVAAQPGVSVHTQCFDGETHSSVFPPAVGAALLTLYPSAAKRTIGSVAVGAI